MSYEPITLPAPRRFGDAPPPVASPQPPKPSMSFRVQEAITAFLAKPYAIPLTFGAVALAFYAVDRMMEKREKSKFQRRMLREFDENEQRYADEMKDWREMLAKMEDDEDRILRDRAERAAAPTVRRFQTMRGVGAAGRLGTRRGY